MRKFWFSLVIVLLLFPFCQAQLFTPDQTLPLAYPTMLNYQLADWDTVFVQITDSSGTVMATVGMSHSVAGKWRGYYSLAGFSPGGYFSEYYAVYEGDTTGEFVPFSVMDLFDAETDTLSFVAKVIYVDSVETLLSQVAGGSADTTAILAMNENHLWGWFAWGDSLIDGDSLYALLIATSDSLKKVQDSLNILLTNSHKLQDSLDVNLALCHTAQDSLNVIVGMLKNGTYGLSILEGLVDDLEGRLTSTRAGYLDYLNHPLPDSAKTEDSLQVALTHLYALAESIDMKLSDVGGLTQADRDSLNKILAKVYVIQDSLNVQLPLAYTAQESLNVLLVNIYGLSTQGDSVTNAITDANKVNFWGAAAGLTAKELADTLKNRNYFAGSGSDTFDLYVFNESSIAQEGVVITVYNMAKTAKVIPSLTTNVDGKKQGFLDPGNYQLYVQRLGVIATEWDTITVPSGGGRDTIWVTSFDPGSPPSADLCLVHGRAWDIEGNPAPGATVELRIIHSPLKFGAILISPYMKSTTTDVNGYWSKTVFPNSVLNPTTTKYHVKITLPSGGILEKDVTVPDSTTWELTW